MIDFVNCSISLALRDPAKPLSFNQPNVKNLFNTPLRPTVLAASALIAGSLLPATAVHAADPYDQSLEARVEALEKELNIMENDSKGKNVQTDSTAVPTFIRAAPNVQELVFSGELRLRNEYGVTDNQAANNTTQSDVDRFRFRLFADYKLDDQFFAGAAVQTALASDSGNTTFSEGFDNYSLYLWRFFVGWHSKDDNLKFIAGKQPNPFYEETEMLWDADISPTGVTEQVKYDFTPQLQIGLIGGQFIFNDNPENAFYDGNGTAATGTAVPGGDNHDDAYLAYQQILGTFKVNDKLAFAAAGGYLFYPGHGGTNSPTTATATTATATAPSIPTSAVSPSSGNAGAGRGAGNSQGQAGNVLQNSAAFNSANSSRNLSIGTFNGDVKLGLGAFKLKVYAQAAYNFQGGARDAQEYGTLATGGVTARGLEGTTDKTAFSTGFTIGSDFQIKKKGDYLLLAEYRQVGLGSVDPNLNDSDWNFSRLGFRGIKVAGSYAFYPWLIGTVTYFGSNNLGDEKNLNIAVGNYNASHIIQFDLTARF